MPVCHLERMPSPTDPRSSSSRNVAMMDRTRRFNAWKTTVAGVSTVKASRSRRPTRSMVGRIVWEREIRSDRRQAVTARLVKSARQTIEWLSTLRWATFSTRNTRNRDQLMATSAIIKWSSGSLSYWIWTRTTFSRRTSIRDSRRSQRL